MGRNYFRISVLRTTVVYIKDDVIAGSVIITTNRCIENKFGWDLHEDLKSKLYAPIYISEKGRIMNASNFSEIHHIHDDIGICHLYPTLLNYTKVEKLEEKYECPCCKVDFEYEDDLITTHCDHKFCKKCYERVDRCPLCRADLTE